MSRLDQQQCAAEGHAGRQVVVESRHSILHDCAMTAHVVCVGVRNRKDFYLTKTL